MKKRNAMPLVAALVVAVLAAAGCEPEENAQIVVRNELGFDVAGFYLTGDEETGNLLEGGVIPDGADSFTVPKEVAPGTYRWKVVYQNAPKQSDEGTEDVELFPGQNHVVLSITPVF